MISAFYWFCIYFALLFSYLIILIFLIHYLKADRPAHTFKGELPFISILIAARNEEEIILSCLRSVEALSWPSDKLEVLIGDDQSTDSTAERVSEFIKDKKNFRLIRIETTMGKAKGKANVLAHLARQANGAFYFITDADINVPVNWIQSLMANSAPSIGIVSGVTKMKVATFFDYCQSIDWVYGFSMIKTASDCNIPVSAVGNNMMIQASAYKSTGGYEHIPFSVTEDHALFVAVRKHNWQYKNLMSYDCMATTEPVASLSKLLAQRKRWMQGAVKVPFVLLLFLFLQALFIPVVLMCLYFFPLYGIIFWGFKLVLQQYFIVISFRKIRQPYQVLKGALAYEVYSGLLSPLVLLNYLIPTKVKWKGRTY